MSNTFGFGTDTTGFSSTIHDDIQKAVVATLRAGLISLPKGTVVPGVVVAQSGANFTVRLTEYPDLASGTQTNPLTEGVAPSALKLGIDTLDFTVSQVGARTEITDLAEIQSPHNLKSIAGDKIARLAADTFDSIGLTALAAVSSAGDASANLSTELVLDAIAVMQGRNVPPVPGAGYYFLMHPYALRGLTGEDGLNGYVDVTAQANAGAISSGAVGQYRGATFLTSTKIVPTASNYPVYVLGQGSMGAGDVSTLSYHPWQGAQPGNELAQLSGLGFKGIFGAKAISFSDTADGSGTNASDTVRAYSFTVYSGVTSPF